MDGAVTVPPSAAVVFLVAVLSAPAFAQSAVPPLGDVAKKAQEDSSVRRKATRTYSNKDLAPDPNGSAAPTIPEPAAGGAFMSSALGRPVTAEEVISRSADTLVETQAKPNEAEWRARAGALRGLIEKNERRLETLMKPTPNRPEAAQARQDVEIAKVQKVLAGLAKQWAALETHATAAGAPALWLEPRPNN